MSTIAHRSGILSSAAGGLWTPSELGAAYLWGLDSDSGITTSGDDVTQWDDLAGAGDLVQNGAKAIPTSGLTTHAGKNVVEFENGDQLVTTGGPDANYTELTICILFKNDILSDSNGMLFQIGPAAVNFTGINFEHVTTTTLRARIAGVLLGTNMSVADDTWAILTATFDGATTTGTQRLDGLEISTTGSTAANEDFKEVVIGARSIGSDSRHIAGGIIAAYVINSSDSSDVEKLEGYVAHLLSPIHTLDAGHPYVTNPPTV